MKLKVSRTEMWTASIEDRPGGAAGKLEPMAKAGANLEFAFARRTPELPGGGVLFVCPAKGAKGVKAAQAAGLAKADNLHSVRVEGTDQPGVTARIARAMSNAGINFRALSASAVGSKFVAYLALDTAEDAAKAVGVLKKLA